MTSSLMDLRVGNSQCPISEEPVASVRSLCEKMGHVTIVSKGENDIISNGSQGR